MNLHLFFLKALERKYHAQKAIVIKMEEAILELRVNADARSPDSDRTGNFSFSDVLNSFA